MYAVIRTGGKQHRVAQGDIITVEHLPGEVGATVVFDQVLAVSDDGQLTTEKDELAKASVRATILAQIRDDKVTVFKYKKRKGYARTKGHRQQLTRLEIEAIETSSAAKPAPKKAAEAKAPAEKAAAKKAPAAKASAKKAPAAKAPAKKAPEKKAPAKKAGPAEAAAKPAPKKAAAKQPAAKKPASGGAGAKKSTPKKPAAPKKSSAPKGGKQGGAPAE